VQGGDERVSIASAHRCARRDVCVHAYTILSLSRGKRRRGGARNSLSSLRFVPSSSFPFPLLFSPFLFFLFSFSPAGRAFSVNIFREEISISLRPCRGSLLFFIPPPPRILSSQGDAVSLSPSSSLLPRAHLCFLLRGRFPATLGPPTTRSASIGRGSRSPPMSIPLPPNYDYRGESLAFSRRKRRKTTRRVTSATRVGI